MLCFGERTTALLWHTLLELVPAHSDILLVNSMPTPMHGNGTSFSQGMSEQLTNYEIIGECIIESKSSNKEVAHLAANCLSQAYALALGSIEPKRHPQFEYSMQKDYKESVQALRSESAIVKHYAYRAKALRDEVQDRYNRQRLPEDRVLLARIHSHYEHLGQLDNWTCIRPFSTDVGALQTEMNEANTRYRTY